MYFLNPKLLIVRLVALCTSYVLYNLSQSSYFQLIWENINIKFQRTTWRNNAGTRIGVCYKIIKKNWVFKMYFLWEKKDYCTITIIEYFYIYIFRIYLTSIMHIRYQMQCRYYKANFFYSGKIICMYWNIITCWLQWYDIVN